MTDDDLVRKVAQAQHDLWMSSTTTGTFMWRELAAVAIATVRAHDGEPA